MTTAFLVQMAGRNGAGKSTVARAVASSTGAVVLDHDTTKSAIMAAGVPHPPAGAASYEVIFELAAELLDQGHRVIIDSPSAYVTIPARGIALAEAAGVRYFFVECRCPDVVGDHRVNARSARPSQVTDAAEAAAVAASAGRTPHRPRHGALVIDTTTPISECVDLVLAYLRTPGASGPSIPATHA